MRFYSSFPILFICVSLAASPCTHTLSAKLSTNILRFFMWLSVFRVYIFPCNKFQFSNVLVSSAYMHFQSRLLKEKQVASIFNSLLRIFSLSCTFVFVCVCVPHSTRIEFVLPVKGLRFYFVFLYIHIVSSLERRERERKRENTFLRWKERERENKKRMDRVQSYFAKMVLVEWAH